MKEVKKLEVLELEKNIKEIKDAELDIEILKRENEKLCLENNIKIGKLEVVVEDVEIALKKELKKSGEDKLECKLGSVSFKKMPDEWKYQDEILMSWIISLPAKLKNLYLKVTTTVKKGDLKKQIISDNEELFEKSKLVDVPINNDIFLIYDDIPPSPFKVEGIEIKPQDPKFSITIKKKK